MIEFAPENTARTDISAFLGAGRQRANATDQHLR
jgi:hypothetical protein